MEDMGLAEPEAEHALTTGRMSARSQRIELITRGERRRSWAIEQKREIVLESLQPGARPADVARQYGINTGLLYTWRRKMLEGQLGDAPRLLPSFARGHRRKPGHAGTVSRCVVWVGLRLAGTTAHFGAIRQRRADRDRFAERGPGSRRCRGR